MTIVKRVSKTNELKQMNGPKTSALSLGKLRLSQKGIMDIEVEEYKLQQPSLAIPNCRNKTREITKANKLYYL